MNDIVATVQAHFGLRMKQATAYEWYSIDGCPFCGGTPGKSDRFRLFIDSAQSGPRLWCRQCGKFMFVDSLDKVSSLSRDEIDKIQEEVRAARLAERQSALDSMAVCTDHLSYHRNVVPNGKGIDYWLSEGIPVQSIKKFKLGYCHSCPTAPYSSSYTIPYMYDGGLYDIRHRLVNPNGHGKYRRHMSGLPSLIYNADALNVQYGENIFIVEGEKKGIVASDRVGINFVAVAGKCGFKRAWVSKFDRFKTVFVCYDPDALDKASEVAALFGVRGRLVTLPLKLDDFFVKAGGTANDFKDFLAMARSV